LVAISPELPEKRVELVKERGLTLPILWDEGGAYADELGLRFEFPEDLRAVYESFGIDVGAANGDGLWRLPMPARYVIETSGRVRDSRVHADYTRRPEPEETLAALGQEGA
jgi:peroxiredoxin